jgi:hypothetical protein
MKLLVDRCVEHLPLGRRLAWGTTDPGAPAARWFVQLVAFGRCVALLGRERGAK